MIEATSVASITLLKCTLFKTTGFRSAFLELQSQAKQHWEQVEAFMIVSTIPMLVLRDPQGLHRPIQDRKTSTELFIVKRLITTMSAHSSLDRTSAILNMDWVRYVPSFQTRGEIPVPTYLLWETDRSLAEAHHLGCLLHTMEHAWGLLQWQLFPRDGWSHPSSRQFDAN